MHIFDRHRCTGRTTRLIDHAIELAERGKAVYVIARQWQALQRLIDKRMPRSGIKCEGHLPQKFCWESRRVDGSHPNCVWLIDHHYIESDPVFVSMVAAMTKFDEPRPEGCCIDISGMTPEEASCHDHLLHRSVWPPGTAAP